MIWMVKYLRQFEENKKINLFIHSEPSIIQRLDMQVNESFNSSFKDVSLIWKEPEHANGIIQKYIVRFKLKTFLSKSAFKLAIRYLCCS